MEKGLGQQSREFIAGDRVLRSAHDVLHSWLDEAQHQGLIVSRQLSFSSMTFAGDMPQLAAVKAVDNRYPLYEKLETSPAGLGPQPGSVLLAPRLIVMLRLKAGDSIEVGDASFRVVGKVIQEPDAGFSPFQIAPASVDEH